MIRQRAIAEQISQLMIDIGARLDSSVILVQSQCSAEEFAVYRRAVGTIMGEMLLEVMNPLYAQHPDLRPSELK
jgi:hypothetical protein